VALEQEFHKLQGGLVPACFEVCAGHLDPEVQRLGGRGVSADELVQLFQRAAGLVLLVPRPGQGLLGALLLLIGSGSGSGRLKGAHRGLGIARGGLQLADVQIAVGHPWALGELSEQLVVRGQCLFGLPLSLSSHSQPVEGFGGEPAVCVLSDPGVPFGGLLPALEEEVAVRQAQLGFGHLRAIRVLRPHLPEGVPRLVVVLAVEMAPANAELRSRGEGCVAVGGNHLLELPDCGLVVAQVLPGHSQQVLALGGHGTLGVLREHVLQVLDRFLGLPDLQVRPSQRVGGVRCLIAFGALCQRGPVGLDGLLMLPKVMVAFAQPVGRPSGLLGVGELLKQRLVGVHRLLVLLCFEAGVAQPAPGGLGLGAVGEALHDLLEVPDGLLIPAQAEQALTGPERRERHVGVVRVLVDELHELVGRELVVLLPVEPLGEGQVLLGLLGILAPAKQRERQSERDQEQQSGDGAEATAGKLRPHH